MVRRWYQTLDITGPDVVYEDPLRQFSKFWNEGKFHNFIEPLLPEARQVFIEIGCNAGLFLKMAKDAGFDRVVGVEGNGQIFQQANRYRDNVNGDWTLVGQKVGHNFTPDTLPLADVVLISNMHYYLPVGVFSKLVDALRPRCRYCIVVSARAKRRSGKATWELPAVKGYFREWPLLETINNIEHEGDPGPRPEMYGALFQGGLSSVDVEGFYKRWWQAAKSPGHKSHELAPSMNDFYCRVLNNEDFDYADTLFYKFWRKRAPRKSEEWTLRQLDYKARLALDILEHGMKEPIYFTEQMKLLDGIHRLTIAHLLGHEHILARIL